MYDGTLAEDWRALITFQQMIILSDADGHVDLTPSALSRRTGIPIEHIKAGIEILEAPDKYSRTEGSDGRRIELIDEHRPWGWVIVNHKMYRDISDAQTVREQTRERVRKHREKKKCNVTVTPSNASNAIQIQDTNTKKNSSRFAPPTLDDVNKYISEKGYQVDGERFINFYESKDWMVGKNKMKKWKAALANWNSSNKKPEGNAWDGAI
jgi:hypothetical protein